MSFNFDINSAINQQTQGFDALGELGRFMLQKRQSAAQLALQKEQESRLKGQQDYQRQQEEAARKRLDARNAALSGALFKDLETPVYRDEESVDTFANPDLQAFMQGMGGQNLSARTMGGMQEPAQERPWMSPTLQGLTDTGNGDGAVPPSLAETMTGQKEPEPIQWSLPESPTDIISKRRVQTGTKTERVPNENWMADGARAVAGVDPELAMDLANSDAQAQRIRAGAQDSKTALLNEMRTLTYGIGITANTEQKQLLSDQLTEVSRRYLSLFGAEPEGKSDPGQWLRDYTGNIAVASYGKNADGTITDVAKLKSDIHAAAKSAGYTVLDKDIDAWVEQKNNDLSAAYNAGTKKKMDDMQITSEAERLKQSKIENAYKVIDLKYPNLRAEGIDQVNKSILFVAEGDKGDQSARNGLVKGISRMGSDEALTDTDYGRALGRSFGMNFASRIGKAISGQDIPITDAEWQKLRGFAKTYVDEMRTSVSEADPSGKLLRSVKAWPGAKADAPAAGAGKAEFLPSGMSIGTIVNGYRYKGGDRKKRENWEKVAE